jgi:hypothetical protein
LRPALTYLNSGFAGDELAVGVKRTHWETQKHYADAMEALTRDQLAMRDSLRESLVATTLSKDSIKRMLPTGVIHSEGRRGPQVLGGFGEAIRSGVGIATCTMLFLMAYRTNSLTECRFSLRMILLR